MGIPTDPDDHDYGPNHACWPAGKAPNKLHVYVSGIAAGAGWNPAAGPPPNGSYTLTRIPGTSTWSAPGPAAAHSWTTSIPGTVLRIAAAFGFAFVGGDGANCVFFLVNDFQDPADRFFGGTAIVFQKEPSSPGAPSLADILELLNMDGRESRKSDAFPLDNSHLVAMFADLVESTRIRIKYDFS